MAKDLKRRWKSLKLKVEHLRLELEEKEEVGQSLEDQFRDEIAKLQLEDIEIPAPLQNLANARIIDRTEGAEVQDSGSVDMSDRPEEMKKLWKAVAAAAHPDKTGNDEEKTALYKMASVAWTEGSYDELCRIAGVLGIDIPLESPAAVSALEKIAEELEKKIKDAEKSVLFEWGAAPENKKAAILDFYLRSKGKKRKAE